MKNASVKNAILGRTSAVALLVVLLASAAVAASPYYRDEPQIKVLTGKVVNHEDAALPGAVVYLANTRTRAVKTYIAGAQGEYRFPGLAPNTDYEVYAQFQGHKSDTKSVSQFDTRAQVTLNLKIDTR